MKTKRVNTKYYYEVLGLTFDDYRTLHISPYFRYKSTPEEKRLLSRLARTRYKRRLNKYLEWI